MCEKVIHVNVKPIFFLSKVIFLICKNIYSLNIFYFIDKVHQRSKLVDVFDTYRNMFWQFEKTYSG